MDAAGTALYSAAEIYTRATNETSTTDTTTNERPPVYKIIGICLAIGSGLFIGTSFVLKKVGLLKANEKYSEVAGEGYGYLKNGYWWGGMTLMILGEILNFVAYAFTDAILVTPLGALSVVITTIGSAIFLKERLSMVGKVACFLCIIGSVVIVLNAPEESSVSDIQEMQHYVIAPGFLSYAGVILVGSAIVAFWLGPKYGKKNMLVYISICSWVGGLSVVATQGLGAAIVAQIGGKAQFNQWFIYVLMVFVIGTLLTEIIFLNKALNLFNAAMVTPTYYVYFTSTTIITSAVLFRGFKGSADSIVTVVMGFLVICSGVVLLQLSKSAKDVPDAAVFAGDLDQIHTIAEQDQSETEPKADAIRGAAAIVRRISMARQNRELDELKRLHQEKQQDRLASVSEDALPEFEWDGLRRRKTMMGSQRQRSSTFSTTFSPKPSTPHPPLGMSHFPTESDLEEHDRPASAGLSSIVGTIRSRTRSILPGHPEFRAGQEPSRIQSPMHPVQLTDITVPAHGGDGTTEQFYGVGNYGLPQGRTEYDGSGPVTDSHSRRIQFGGDNRLASQASEAGLAPTPPPHSAKRQFSFQNVFRRNQQHAPTVDDGAHEAPRPGSSARPISSKGYSAPHAKTATEEERIGLVKGDSNTSLPQVPSYDEDDYGYDDDNTSDPYVDDKATRYGRGITASSSSSSPPRGRRASDEKKDGGVTVDVSEYEERRKRWNDGRGQSPDGPPPPAPPHGGPSRGKPGGAGGAFI